MSLAMSFRAMSFKQKLPLILLLNAIPAFCLWMDHRERVARSKTVAHCIDVRIPAEAAIAACSDVISAYPKAVWAYTNRGLAYGSSGDQDRAIDDLDTAIGLIGATRAPTPFVPPPSMPKVIGIAASSI